MERDEYLDELGAFSRSITDTCPDSLFVTVIARHWLQDVAPARARDYGMEFWQRFGAVGVFYQLLNCWYRWRHTMTKRDTIVDTFGYAVLFALSLEQHASDINWRSVWLPATQPEIVEWQEYMIMEVLDVGMQYEPQPSHAWIALRIAYAQWMHAKELAWT